jgi:predicted lipoprotein with Yx(FWY)xxD motif
MRLCDQPQGHFRTILTGDRMFRSNLFVAALAASLATLGCSTMGSGASGPARMSNGMLVGSNGMTLYTFDRDAANSGKSACNGPCATLWPPLAATASDQASGDWTVVVRDDRSRQWAYKGKPLYYYQNDKQAGEKAGDNFRDVWHIVK